MANEDASPGTVCFTKKRIRLSRVVDKLAVLGNGTLLADRENNNVSYSQASPTPLQMTPQLASTVPQAYPFIPHSAQAVANMCRSMPQVGSTVPDVMSILPESGKGFLQSYFMYGVPSNVPPSFLTMAQSASSGPQVMFKENRSPLVSHTATSGSYGTTPYFNVSSSSLSAEEPHDSGYNCQNTNPNRINGQHANSEHKFKEEITSEGRHEVEKPWPKKVKKVKLEPLDGQEYQNAPLDLSVKGCSVNETKGKKVKTEPKQSVGSKGRLSRSTLPKGSEAAYPVVCGDVASPTTRESVAARYNLQVSPVVEQMPLGSDTAWACPVCGQLFSQRDRLAKHVASRHRGRSPSRSHICHKCNRGFSRSDMLTRHLRLHTGQKPYRCLTCGQIFSRSDHLATHRRTHTGEKPYKCPQCPYAACRRDMITRHMRTHRTLRAHSRSDQSDSEESCNSSIMAPLS